MNSAILTVASPSLPVGMNFGIQIAWVVVNIGTIILFSMFVSKRYLDQYRKSREIGHDAEGKREVDAV